MEPNTQQGYRALVLWTAGVIILCILGYVFYPTEDAVGAESISTSYVLKTVTFNVTITADIDRYVISHGVQRIPVSPFGTMIYTTECQKAFGKGTIFVGLYEFGNIQGFFCSIPHFNRWVIAQKVTVGKHLCQIFKRQLAFVDGDRITCTAVGDAT